MKQKLSSFNTDDISDIWTEDVPSNVIEDNTEDNTQRRIPVVGYKSSEINLTYNDLKDIGKRPHMTAVGSGLNDHTAHIPVSLKHEHQPNKHGSFWNERGADLFRDPRARRVGDIVTVEVSVKDKASLDNSSDRSQASTRDLDLGLDYNLSISL